MFEFYFIIFVFKYQNLFYFQFSGVAVKVHIEDKQVDKNNSLVL